MAAGTSAAVAAKRIPRALPWSAGLTTMGKRRRSSMAPRASPAPSSLKAVSVKA